MPSRDGNIQLPGNIRRLLVVIPVMVGDQDSIDRKPFQRYQQFFVTLSILGEGSIKADRGTAVANTQCIDLTLQEAGSMKARESAHSFISSR